MKTACGMFLSKGFFQFSMFDNRTRIQAYSAPWVLHHTTPGWTGTVLLLQLILTVILKLTITYIYRA